MSTSIPSWCTGVIVRDETGVEIQFSSCRLTNGAYVLSSVLRESHCRSPVAYGPLSRWRCASRPVRRSDDPRGRTSVGRRPPASVRMRGSLRIAERARASRKYLEFEFFQATKSQRWMPWRREPMKDVGDCEKLRGAVYQALIRRCPNGETQHS